MWAGSVHSGLILVFAGIALLNLMLLLAVGVWWLRSGRKPAFPHRGFAAWFALLLASAASYFPSSLQYAAVAVLLFGPGAKSQEFQMRAAERDSIVLLDALILRGASPDQGALCAAARYDSPNVINRLVARSVPVNAECNARKTTALHEAVTSKQHRNAEILVQAGAKADLPDARGTTPLDVARQQTDDRMIEILTQAGQPRP
jgi:Ankyrin repeats (3 copies)